MATHYIAGHVIESVIRSFEDLGLIPCLAIEVNHFYAPTCELVVSKVPALTENGMVLKSILMLVVDPKSATLVVNSEYISVTMRIASGIHTEWVPLKNLVNVHDLHDPSCFVDLSHMPSVQDRKVDYLRLVK